MPALPTHVGVIMDGNGRWAKLRGMKRTEGHSAGLKVSKRIVKKARDMGVKYISLYVFSTENWKRAEEEVGFLMTLISSHLRNEYDFYRENGIRVVHSGDFTGLPKNVREAVIKVESETANFNGALTVNLLINYGGRDEIMRAVHRCLTAGSAIDAYTLSKNLDRPELPDVDLVIRTAGEKRLSNFMSWQCSYAEYAFTDTLWPDFNEEEFACLLDEYVLRERKFGGIT